MKNIKDSRRRLMDEYSANSRKNIKERLNHIHQIIQKQHLANTQGEKIQTAGNKKKV